MNGTFLSKLLSHFVHSIVYDKYHLMAWNLLDIFENNSEAWNAVRYINRSPKPYDITLEQYLSNWYLCTPRRWQFVVEEIIHRFGVSRLTKPTLTQKADSPHDRSRDHAPYKGHEE